MRSEAVYKKCLSLFCRLSLQFLFIVIHCSLISGCFALPVLSQESKQLSQSSIDYSQERPANFVFLVDVSGSIISPRTMVKAKDGSSITLFEALRQALKQIVQDERLLGPKSKIAFITFGTAVTEKSDWPTSLSSSKDRALLLEKISSSTELAADKHGDTYMAGGLEAAYNRALEFAKDSEPCTSTFIVMLTDGWDEPPAGATLNISNEAKKFQDKEKELKQKLGVNTWQMRVVGLQRLPEKKQGTTTAAELSKLLGGEFLDVSKAETGTVGERIYAAMKKTISELRGQIDLPAEGSQEAVIDFGRIGSNPTARGSCSVWNRSCYVEKLTGVKDVSGKLKSSDLLHYRKLIEDMSAAGHFPELPEHGKSLVMSSDLPAAAISLKLDPPEPLLAPVEREGARAGEASAKVAVLVSVGAACPPGAYMGLLEFQSQAKVPALIPYLVCVPSRLTVDQTTVKAQVRKPGFIFDKDTSTELAFRVGARVNSSYSSDFELSIEGGPALRVQEAKEKSKTAAQLSSKLINRGESLSASVKSGDAQGSPVKLEMQIPADTEAGIYEGKIAVKCKEHNDLVADTSVPYVVEVLPSPWDEMSPVAIPVLLILVLLIAIAAYMAVIGSRDRM